MAQNDFNTPKDGKDYNTIKQGEVVNGQLKDQSYGQDHYGINDTFSTPVYGYTESGDNNMLYGGVDEDWKTERDEYSDLKRTYFTNIRSRGVNTGFWLSEQLKEGQAIHHYNAVNRIDDPIFTGFTLSIDMLNSPLFFTLGEYDSTDASRHYGTYDKDGNYVANTKGHVFGRSLSDEIENCLKASYVNKITGVDAYSINNMLAKDYFSGSEGAKIGFGLQHNVYGDELLYGATEYIYMVDKDIQGNRNTDPKGISLMTEPNANIDEIYKANGNREEIIEELTKKKEELLELMKSDCTLLQTALNIDLTKLGTDTGSSDSDTAEARAEAFELHKEYVEKYAEFQAKVQQALYPAEIQTDKNGKKVSKDDYLKNDLAEKEKAVSEFKSNLNNNKKELAELKSKISSYGKLSNIAINDAKSTCIVKIKDGALDYNNKKNKNDDTVNNSEGYLIGLITYCGQILDAIISYAKSTTDKKYFSDESNVKSVKDVLQYYAAFGQDFIFNTLKEFDNDICDNINAEKIKSRIKELENEIKEATDEKYDELKAAYNKAVADYDEFKKEMYGAKNRNIDNAIQTGLIAQLRDIAKNITASDNIAVSEIRNAEYQNQLNEVQAKLNAYYSTADESLMISAARDKAIHDDKSLHYTDADKYKYRNGETVGLDADSYSELTDTETGVKINPGKSMQPDAPQTVYDMLAFIKGMRSLTNEYPYILQTVTGLDEVYKKHYGVKDSLLGGGDEGKISITCYESLDLRVSTMFNRYFNAVYDRQYRRERVPVNLRRFNCSIFVHDIRDFYRQFSILGYKIRLENTPLSKLIDIASHSMSAIEFKFYDCEIIPEETGGIFETVTNADRGEMRQTKFTFKYGNAVVNFLPFKMLLENYMNYGAQGMHTGYAPIKKGTPTPMEDLRVTNEKYYFGGDRNGDVNIRLKSHIGNVYGDNNTDVSKDNETLENIDNTSSPGKPYSAIYKLDNVNDKVIDGDTISMLGNVNDDDSLEEKITPLEDDIKNREEADIVAGLEASTNYNYGSTVDAIFELMATAASANLHIPRENVYDNFEDVNYIRKTLMPENNVEMVDGYDLKMETFNVKHNPHYDTGKLTNKPASLFNLNALDTDRDDIVNTIGNVNDNDVFETKHHYDNPNVNVPGTTSVTTLKGSDKIYTYLGDVLPDDPQNGTVGYIGDVLPDDPHRGNVSYLGDVLPDDVFDPKVQYIGDVLPDDVFDPKVQYIGDVLPDDPYKDPTTEIGNVYPANVETPNVEYIDDVLPDDEKRDLVDRLGNVYPAGAEKPNVKYIDDVLPDDKMNDFTSHIGNVNPKLDDKDKVVWIDDVLEDPVPKEKLTWIDNVNKTEIKNGIVKNLGKV